MDSPFWEKTYREDDISTFGEPSIEIKQLSQELDKNSKILDVGCGEGRNAIYLAENGFDVEAFDISDAGIGKLTSCADSKSLSVNAYTCSIDQFVFKSRYDCIIMHGVLHLVHRNVWENFLLEVKNHTSQNGLNIIAIFTDILPIPNDLTDHCIGLFKDGELKNIYQDWQIEQFDSYQFTDTHPGNIIHEHAANKIIARNRTRLE
ncbi:Tellurite resistance protein TehB [Chitinispirillum alkaliphilum]|nr:Tellurite resistance protein TehB [Chitinispirillum alkaliphilum]